MSSERLDEQRLRVLLEVGRALVSELDLESVLSRVVEVAREVTGAKYAALGVLNEAHDGLDRFLTFGVDPQTRDLIGDLPRGHGVLGVLIREPRPLRLDEVSAHPSSYGFPEHHPPMHTFLGVPIEIRGRVFGNLYLTEKQDGQSFDEADEEAAVVLAQWAAIAIDNARSVLEERLRQSIRSAEEERGRWARALHDETLQGLGALRVLLASSLRAGTGPEMERAVADAVAQLGSEIQNLRSLITDLRPAALKELGLQVALESLARRAETRDGMRVKMVVARDHEPGTEEERLHEDLETAVYRVAQEALTNIGRHSRAEEVGLELLEAGQELRLTIQDDGVGFEPGSSSTGFGLKGMRERAELAGGRLEVESSPGNGTRLSATFPVRRSSESSAAG